MSELKPCPFCGCEVIHHFARYGRNGWFLFVRCEVCGAESKKIGLGEYFKAPEDDIVFWNCKDVLSILKKLNAAWNMRNYKGGEN